jgi:hypothetical protein
VPDGFLRVPRDLIRAAERLRLTDLIAASFPIAAGIPIAVTGLALPTPYNHVFHATGTLTVVAGAFILVRQAVRYANRAKVP